MRWTVRIVAVEGSLLPVEEEKKHVGEEREEREVGHGVSPTSSRRKAGRGLQAEHVGEDRSAHRPDSFF